MSDGVSAVGSGWRRQRGQMLYVQVLTCRTTQAGQNQRFSPSGTSWASRGGSRHHRWKDRGQPSQ